MCRLVDERGSGEPSGQLQPLRKKTARAFAKEFIALYEKALPQNALGFRDVDLFSWRTGGLCHRYAVIISQVVLEEAREKGRTRCLVLK
jgi:hypothetical protein